MRCKTSLAALKKRGGAAGVFSAPTPKSGSGLSWGGNRPSVAGQIAGFVHFFTNTPFNTF
ncbi:MAG: hypothetical protein LBL45_04590 [Treponema sp.]|jgi:hypothetical protein|nr:hypothetical protein [Treponema sp.]